MRNIQLYKFTVPLKSNYLRKGSDDLNAAKTSLNPEQLKE